MAAQVRAVLVNTCFYAHAAARAFPEGAARAAADARLGLVVAFFGAFSVAIALMKDVPDVAGDARYGVRTLSRALGGNGSQVAKCFSIHTRMRAITL